MKRSEIIKAIEELLMAELPAQGSVETADGAAPRRPGGRVLYVALSGVGKKRETLSQRADQVLSFLEKHKKATSKAIQAALRVNRNVIAGAVHELKQARFVGTQPVHMIEAAAEVPSPRRRAKKSKSRR